MKTKNYIFTAIAAYFLFLITTAPARPVADLINDNTPVNILGVNGTLWSGTAYSIAIHNKLHLKDTSWNVNAWKLFIGQFAAEIDSHLLNNNIHTEIGISLTGNYFVNDLTTKMPVEQITQFAEIPLAQFAGAVSVNIEHAQWSQGELPNASGIINWDNASVTVAESVSLGNITINLGESEQQTLLADIKNQGGDIAITGTAKLVPEADYAIDIVLKPARSAGNNIQQSLGMFAKKQANGDFLFKNSGPLNQIGLM